jgi:HAD superfamily hydrolase (TIGR01549 family)
MLKAPRGAFCYHEAMKDNIQHIWFDMEGTLTVRTPKMNQAHDDLRHGSYAEATGRPLTDDVRNEFNEAYSKYGSNSAVFSSLGLPSDHWQKQLHRLDETKLLEPNEVIRGTLIQLKEVVPISIFTNFTMDTILATLAAIGIDPKWFSHILSGDNVSNRKPALDGFHKIIELSGKSAGEIMYVGDRVNVDILPAKEVSMKTCLVWGHSDEADYSFESFDGLLALIR